MRCCRTYSFFFEKIKEFWKFYKTAGRTIKEKYITTHLPACLQKSLKNMTNYRVKMRLENLILVNFIKLLVKQTIDFQKKKINFYLTYRNLSAILNLVRKRKRKE